MQPPPHTRTPDLPYLGDPRTHVGNGGGKGLSRQSLMCKEWGKGLAEYLEAGWSKGCLRGLEGTRCLIHPRLSGLLLTSHSSPKGPWMMCVWAVLSTCPPSPPGRRCVPFKYPGARAGAAAGAAAAAAPGPTAVPARHKRLSNHSGAGGHQRGGPPAGHASRLPRRIPESQRRWESAQEERLGGWRRSASLQMRLGGGDPHERGCGTLRKSRPYT